MRCASLADSPPLMRVRTRGENLYDKLPVLLCTRSYTGASAHVTPVSPVAHTPRLAGGTPRPRARLRGPVRSAPLQLHACMSRRAPRAPAPDDGRQTTCHAGAMHTARKPHPSGSRPHRAPRPHVACRRICSADTRSRRPRCTHALFTGVDRGARSTRSTHTHTRPCLPSGAATHSHTHIHTPALPHAPEGTHG